MLKKACKVVSTPASFVIKQHHWQATFINIKKQTKV